jgi:hypothetical protein
MTYRAGKPVSNRFTLFVGQSMLRLDLAASVRSPPIFGYTLGDHIRNIG